MAWHKPRFKLVHLSVLVAVIAIELAATRPPLSWILVGLSLLSASLASILGPLTKIEWFGIVSFHYLVYGMLAPMMDSFHRIR